jgi:hypothetical protein
MNLLTYEPFTYEVVNSHILVSAYRELYACCQESRLKSKSLIVNTIGRHFEMSEKTKPSENPLTTWFKKNRKAIFSNLTYRVVFLILDAFLIAGSFYGFSYYIKLETDLVFQATVLLWFVVLLFFPMLYGWRSLNQILFEMSLNVSICKVRAEIKSIRRLKKKDYRALQVKINNFRMNLKDYIDYSKIISPPIFSYELNRLQKGIDVFFNSTSEVLFSKPNIFSRAQNIEQQQTLDEYESIEHPTEDELEEQYDEMQKAEMGIIDWFSIFALDEFLQYLGDTLFVHTERFSPFSYKHPIDLITLSRFFDHWNSIVSSCRNCKTTFAKAKKDVEEYYRLIGRREWQRKQRRQRLTDALMVVIISAVVSTLVNYFMK